VGAPFEYPRWLLFFGAPFKYPRLLLFFGAIALNTNTFTRICHICSSSRRRPAPLPSGVPVPHLRVYRSLYTASPVRSLPLRTSLRLATFTYVLLLTYHPPFGFPLLGVCVGLSRSIFPVPYLPRWLCTATASPVATSPIPPLSVRSTLALSMPRCLYTVTPRPTP
jgi:hypothetical protein